MSCDHALRVSALLDEELSSAEGLTVIDHLLRCPECAAFYRQGRVLDAALLADLAGEGEAPAPPAVWERIAAAVPSTTEPPAPVRRPYVPAWALRVAAALLLLVGGGVMAWQLGPGRDGARQRGARSESAATTVSLAGTARMDEQRFVAIATELLAAEGWYRDAMCEVLTVAREQEPREGSTAESGWREEELRDLRGEHRGVQRAANRSSFPRVAR